MFAILMILNIHLNRCFTKHTLGIESFGPLGCWQALHNKHRDVFLGGAAKLQSDVLVVPVSTACDPAKCNANSARALHQLDPR